METIDTLHELLKHELRDLYSAETQIIDALPAMIEKASNKQLKSALQDHLNVTKKQKERLDKIQELLNDEKNTQPEEKKGFFANIFKSKEGEEHCKAMEGLVKEGSSLLKEDMTPAVMDAGIIAACQKIEHYEISSYGTARAYAQQLNMSIIAGMLEETLNEEYDADDSLTKLALDSINPKAEAPGKSKAGGGTAKQNGKDNASNATAKQNSKDNKSDATAKQNGKDNKGDATAKQNGKEDESAKKSAPRKAMIKKAAPKKAASKKSATKSKSAGSKTKKAAKSA